MEKKKYRLSDEDIIFKNNGIARMIFYFGLLALLCVLSFLVAKYIVNIGVGERPIDTSERI